MNTFALTLDETPEVTQFGHHLRRAYHEEDESSLPVFTVQTLPHGQDIQLPLLIDTFVTHHGYTGLGHGWIEIERRVARKLLVQVLAKSLAYPIEILEEAQATDLANQFLDLFTPNGRYFTNGTCSGEVSVFDAAGEPLLGWRPISQHAFDNGVVAVGNQRLGMLWVEEEPDTEADEA